MKINFSDFIKKKDNMNDLNIVNFNKLFESDLVENSLYTNQAEKDALLADKEKVALAFIFNFLGTIGIINAANPKQLNMLFKHLKDDKNLRISTINDTNHDISLSLKLAYEAGFFKNDQTVNEITKFLVKLKSGQVDKIDSKIVANWVNDLKSDFAQKITDGKIKQAFLEFQQDKGETIDISRLTLVLKKRANKYAESGEFTPFVKRFNHLKELIIDPNNPNFVQTNQPNKTTQDDQSSQSTDDQTSTDTDVPGTISDVQDTPDEPEQHKQIITKEIFDIIYLRLTSIVYSDTTNKDELENKFMNHLAIKLNLNDINELDQNSKEYVDLLVNICLSFKILTSEDIKVNKLTSSIKDITDSIQKIKILTGFEIDIKTLFIDIINYHASILLNIGLLIGYYLKFNEVIDKNTLIRNKTIVQIYKLGLEDLKKELINYYKIDDDFLNNIIRYLKLLPPSFDFINEDNKFLTYFYIDCLYANYNSGYKFNFNAYSDFFTVFGINEIADNLNIDKEYIDKCKAIASKELKKLEYIEQLSSILLNYIKYQTSISKYYNYSNSSGTFFEVLHETLAKDILKNGLVESEMFQKTTIYKTSETRIKEILNIIGVNFDELLKKFPKDEIIKRVYFITSDINTLSLDEISNNIISYDTTDNIFSNSILIFNKLKGEKEDNINRITASITQLLENGYNVDNIYDANTFLYKVLSYTSKENTNKLMKLIQTGKLKSNLFSLDYFNNISDKERKEDFIQTVSSMFQDVINTNDIELRNFLNEFITSLPYAIMMKIRNNLIGGNSIINEIEKGEIQSFNKIDSARLKKIFLYNDINLSKLISESIGGKKKKAETILEYFERAVQNSKQSGSVLEELKVKINEEETKNVKVINKLIIERDHAGKHGNIYPKITKVYDCHLTFTEFEEFRKNNFGDGAIIPAYHGTGGIAAGMILRYGFKVIKSTDSSVVGRMLGDGIYFTNKIDKSLQYVSNGGYSRQAYQKGYILSLDTNLGKINENYNIAGTGIDSIRTPEWCVFDPKAQTKILKVYEVTLVPKHDIDKYLNENNETNKTKNMKFSKYLNEEKIQKRGNTSSFIFRDGQIPIIDNDENITYKDFEQALKDKDISRDMFDISRQGPVIVFSNTKEQIVCDERYASHLMGNALILYKKLFLREMNKIKKK